MSERLHPCGCVTLVDGSNVSFLKCCGKHGHLVWIPIADVYVSKQAEAVQSGLPSIDRWFDNPCIEPLFTVTHKKMEVMQ